MTTLYGVFPVAMAWSMRSSVKRKAGKSDKYKDYKRLVPGGRFTLVLMGLCAAGIMGGQAMLDSKLVSSYHLAAGFGSFLTCRTSGIVSQNY
jgi:hypothetical protein